MNQLRLGWDGHRDFNIDEDLLATGRTCVLGIAGRGKSYTVRVICEELCKNDVPFALLDVEREYSGLKEKYDVVWVGDEKDSDLQWGRAGLEELARRAPSSVPLLLDISATEDWRSKINSIVSALYTRVSADRRPYLIVVEEADKFIPQNGERLQIFDEIARRGRKRGLGLMICTQRPSLVDKNVLSQCSNQLIGRLMIKNDLQSVTQFFQGRMLPKDLTTLPQGRFYVAGGLSAIPRYIQVRSTETTHGGSTPRLADLKLVGSRELLNNVARNGTSSIMGLQPLIDTSEVVRFARPKRNIPVFGAKEVIESIGLVCARA